ncbi:MAG: tetratricopeptide repeat protein [Bacteroidales bacterium]|nr:tetratricopeptide repeat protein [Bacteroidales bacterium]
MDFRKFFAIIMVVTALSAVTAFSQDKKAGAPDLLDAVAAIDSQRFSEAEGILKAVTAAEPGNDAAWYYLGLCRLYIQDLKGAQEALKKASEIDPGNYWYKDRLAIAYSMTGEEDMTISTYEELLKEFPKKNELYFSLVNLYLKQNEFDKALAAMDQIETVFGKSESVTSTRYDILLRQNKPEEALKTLEEYNKEFSSPYVLTKLGDHSMAEYKDSLALAYYSEALDLQGNYAPALLGEAEVYRTRRDNDSFFKTVARFIDDEDTPPQAKAQYMSMLVQRTEPRFIQNFKADIDSLFETMVLRHPSDTNVLKTSGLYYYTTDRGSKARSLLHRNMVLNPESLDAAASYVQLLGYQSDWKALSAAADSAFARFPREAMFLDMKNVALYNEKDWNGVIETCRKIIATAPSDTSVTVPALATMGDMYHELGDTKTAYKYYKLVLKLDPDHSPALNNYAYYLSLEGKNLKKALQMSKKTIEKEPDNATYLDTYGWILHLLGKDQDAKAVFKHAMIYGGKDSSTILEHYAEVLQALGEKDLATFYHTQAANKKASETE